MIENHEILCPRNVECPICQTSRDQKILSKIEELFDINEDINLLTKHFYKLTISLTPTRETYHHFSLEPLKKSGRELINGLSSLSSVSNRSWWSMYVEGGVRLYSVYQKEDDYFPTFNTQFIFYSNHDNLDVKMNVQLKYRLKKISRHLTFSMEYLGQYNIPTILNSINLKVSVIQNSDGIKKLGEEIMDEINKIKDQKPIVFGKKYNSKTINQLELK